MIEAKTLKPRRKPSQSRAWMTAGAIQDAFLINLVENGYERVSMRNIADVAGVGLGTLYLYFPNKESIAAVTLRSWLRNLAKEIGVAVENSSDGSLRDMTDAVTTTYIASIYQHSEQWRVLLFVERRITERAVYQDMFQHFVGKLAAGFAQAKGLAPSADVQHLAFLAFSIMNAMVRETLQVLDVLPERETLTRAIQGAVWGGIAAMLGTSNPATAEIRPLRRHLTVRQPPPNAPR